LLRSWSQQILFRKREHDEQEEVKKNREYEKDDERVALLRARKRKDSRRHRPHSSLLTASLQETSCPALPQQKDMAYSGETMFGLGIGELLIILVIVLVVFGAGKLPEIGEGIGRGIQNFRKSVKTEEIDITPDKDAEKQPDNPSS
jgi:sec-independent protein translocase protein TatA